jgi:tetratricopeptide (TPR) repeat protein
MEGEKLDLKSNFQTFITESKSKYFYERKTFIDDLHSKLRKSNLIVISGCGKSAFIAYYVKRFMLKDFDLIRWIDADREEKILDEYRRCLIETNAGNTGLIKGFSGLVNKIVDENNRKALLVYDDLSHFSPALIKHLSPKVKIIITCSKPEILSNIEYEKIHLKPFSNNDFNTYFRSIFREKISNDQLNRIYKIFDSSLLASPLNINRICAMLQLDRKIDSVIENLQTRRDLILKQIYYEKLIQNYKYKDVLMVLLGTISILDSKQIDAVFLNDLMNNFDRKIYFEILEYLEKYMLIELRESFIKIHPIHQREMLDYFTRKEDTEMDDIKRNILYYLAQNFHPLSNLLSHALNSYENISEKMPTSVSKPNTLIQILFLTRLKNFYENILFDSRKTLELSLKIYDFLQQIFCLKNNGEQEISSILHSIGNAYLNLDELNLALEYFKRCQDLREKLSNQDDQILLSNTYQKIAQCYSKFNNQKNALDFYEKALEVKIKSSEINENYQELYLLYEILGDTCFNLKEFERANEYYDKAKRLLNDEDEEKLGILLNKIGKTFGNLGEFEKELDFNKKSYEILTKIYPNETSFIANLLLNIGDSYDSVEEYEPALELKEKALHVLNDLYKEADHKDLAYCLNSLSCTYEKMDEYEQALIHKTRSYEIYKRIYRNSNEFDDFLCEMQISIAILYENLNQVEKAKEFYELSLELRRNLLKNNSSNTKSLAVLLQRLGIVHSNLKNNDRALAYLLESYDLHMKDINASTSSKLENCLSLISKTYENLGQYEKSIEFKIGLLEMRKIASLSDSTTIHIIYDLGHLYYDSGNYEKSLEYYRLALEGYSDSNLSENAMASLYLNIANCLFNLNDYTLAYDYYSNTLEKRKDFFMEENSEVADVLTDLGICEYKMKKYEDAVRDLQYAIEMYKRSLISYTDFNVRKIQRNFEFLIKCYEKLNDAKTSSQCRESLDLFLTNKSL